jgi:hypothetical protein
MRHDALAGKAVADAVGEIRIFWGHSSTFLR